MSKISTLHDAIVTKISTNLTSYKQLPNPYVIEDNNILYLTKGYGVAFGPGTATNRLIGCQLSWQRIMIITLINKVTTTDHNTTVRETLAKGLLEDHFTLLKKFEQEFSLSNNAIEGVIVSDGGIEYIEIDDRPYYMTEIELSLEYFEDITT